MSNSGLNHVALSGLILVHALVSSAFAETIIPPGEVHGTWTRDGSPYVVTGDINIPPGQLLRINAGVTVAFTDYWQLLGYGRIESLGEFGDSVLFTTTSIDTSSYWAGMILSASFNGGNIFRYTIIEHATHGLAYLGALQSAGGIHTVSHCTIRDNSAPGWVISAGAEVVAEHVVICRNGGNWGCGSGIWLDQSTADFSYCKIFDNNPTQSGTGFCIFRCLVRMYHCEISGNTTQYWGGGGYVGDAARYEAHACTFADNICQKGGALDIHHADSVYIARSTFVNNQAILTDHAGDGGALRIYGHTRICNINHCTFVDNVGEFSSVIDVGFGGADIELNVSHSIFAHNEGPQFNFRSHHNRIKYCSLFDSTHGSFYSGTPPDGYLRWVRINANGDSSDTSGNIIVEPLFRDENARDFRLQPLSRCIDAGFPDGDPDPDGTVSDIGRFWYFQGINSAGRIEPQIPVLMPPTPNPFNPATRLTFELREAGAVKLQIFDLNGREVETLASGKFHQGIHEVFWNASALPSGTYFARLQTDNSYSTQKLLLLK